MIFKKEKIKTLEREIYDLSSQINKLNLEIKILRRRPTPSMADLMRESLGIYIDFSTADENGKPPHYLSGLNEDERRQFIIDAKSVFDNKAYQEVVKYMINVFAFHTQYHEDKDQMKNGQVATVAFAAFRKQFDDMDKEFLLLNEKKEEFDPLDPLPE